MFSLEIGSLVVAALAAVGVAGCMFALIYPWTSGDRKKDERVAVVTETRANKLATRDAAASAESRRKTVSDKLKDIEERNKKNKKVTLRLRLQRAGLQITPNLFWMFSAALGIGAALLTYISIGSSFMGLVGTVVSAFVFMFGVPRWIVSMMTKRRQAKFLVELANALDVVTRGIKSGLPLNECLQIIARESPDPICTEFREVVEQQRVGVPLGEALDRLTDRVPLPETRFLSIVIGIQQSSGGNLSEALANLSQVLRDRLGLKLKVAALSSEAKASAAILACLPPGVLVMVYMINPGYIMPLFTTKVGNFMLGAGAFWMLMGVLVMRKMINFKF